MELQLQDRLFIWLLSLNRDLDWWDWAYTYRIGSVLWSPDMNGMEYLVHRVGIINNSIKLIILDLECHGHNQASRLY